MLNDLLGTPVAGKGTEDVGWDREQCIFRLKGVAQERARRAKASPEGERDECSMLEPGVVGFALG